MSRAPHLSVRDLSKSFTQHLLDGGSLTALREVSFEARPGEFLGVMGRSGSGKSSLLRCIYRRYPPTSGQVLYSSEDGLTDLAAAPDREILRLRERELGYVSQFLSAVPRTAALDVVAGPLTRLGAEPDEARERAAGVMRALGLAPGLQDSYPATMSGGEQQRVNLARALAVRYRLLLLDEPTSALDPETRALALERIREHKAAGTTMIGVFHDPDSLRALADRVLILDEGRLRWCGPAAQATDLLAGA